MRGRRTKASDSVWRPKVGSSHDRRTSNGTCASTTPWSSGRSPGPARRSRSIRRSWTVLSAASPSNGNRPISRSWRASCRSRHMSKRWRRRHALMRWHSCRARMRPNDVASAALVPVGVMDPDAIRQLADLKPQQGTLAQVASVGPEDEHVDQERPERLLGARNRVDLLDSTGGGHRPRGAHRHSRLPAGDRSGQHVVGRWPQLAAGRAVSSTRRTR